jgi:hypothetical protein
VFKRIQELQPKNARAARALREIYAQAGDYTALESLYAEHGAFGDLCDQLTSLADGPRTWRRARACSNASR